MMIQLSELQRRKLRSLAAAEGRSMADLVREGVQMLLERERADERWERLWEVVGSCHEPSGVDDVGLHHDRYLAEIHGSKPDLP
jgi:Arc/MetJ-type ribon-helix-helix transcriptional regulator